LPIPVQASVAPVSSRALRVQLAVQGLRVVVGARRHAEAAAELADEVRDARVADLLGDPRHRQVAVDEQFAGAVQAHLLQELVRRPAGDVAEQVRERRRAQADQVRQVGHGQ
jgi:hypothetical protein